MLVVKKPARFISVVAVTGYLVINLVVGGIQHIANQPSLEESVEWVTVRVQEGESIWTLVQEHNPDMHDLRPYVELAREHNGIGATIHPYQQLAIPVIK